MGVEGTAAADAIIAAVEDAGYGASPKSSSKSQSDTAVDRENFLEDKETPVLKKRLVPQQRLERTLYRIGKRLC